MTRALAQDALRYVTREYKDVKRIHNKMFMRHSGQWFKAVFVAKLIWTEHGDRECMAVLQDMVERALKGGK